MRFTPFDPSADTETTLFLQHANQSRQASHPSIHLRILKLIKALAALATDGSFTPFDPSADTETQIRQCLGIFAQRLHTLRSICGY